MIHKISRSMNGEDLQEVTLNIWYHLPKKILHQVPQVYETMPGWLGYAPEGTLKGFPFWFSFDETKKHVTSYTEPSGFKLTGKMNDKEWEKWVQAFKDQATAILGFKVGDIELGEVDYELEWINKDIHQ